ncbi:nicotinamide/nicotinic acid mononucleotide adenylyltransferase 3 isoform X1 [Drosophila albomicans]|uniref:Nicotinamide-nucleotide adenylyltransferase n=1 Tax=Drosophila albomicans TaxID=7291 RepID=A0A6P8XQG6_DROAB|nr:nicotinamide/nicotinic acid mononucleotide adenylyltransferase 3 isoform X1 [Drosophila albomicans]
MSGYIDEPDSMLSLPRVAFIACGCFSPPTPMHLRMFEIARDYFEINGTHKVVGGIISPTHDSYGKKGLAPSLDRCAMVKLAVQSSSWIRLSDWEVHQPQWMRTQAVLQHHQNYLNNYINSPGDEEQNGPLPGWLPLGLRDRKDPIRLKLLCGADLLESFAVPGLWAQEDIEEIVSNYGLVVITRCGSNPEKFIFESDVLTKYQRNITLITNWVPNEVSSSLVRRLLGRGESVKYLLDDLVLNYVMRQGLYNVKSKYITDALRPNHLNFNRSYMDNNKNTIQLDNVQSPQSDMDESDSPLRQQTRVFCCGESTPQAASAAAKLLLNRSGPGQAVQVITVQGKGNMISEVYEESQAKKQKMLQGQQL